MSQDVSVKVVAPVHVLSTRRKASGQQDILRLVRELRPAVADVLVGPPMALRLGFPKDGVFDVEMAFPVGRPLRREGFLAKTLPELPMFSITHVGPLEGGPEGTNLVDTRKKLVSLVNEHDLLVGDDPERFLYHEMPEADAAQPGSYVIEDQYPYHLPMWLRALEEGTTRAAGAEAAARVMAGSEGLAEALDGPRAARWAQGAVGRLDREVKDERDRACILNGCAHHYIVQSGLILEAAAAEVGRDLRKLVEKITDEALLGGKYWIDEAGPEPLLYIRRRPAQPEAYKQATDPAEKRYHACFCPLVRDAIRAGKKVSRTFCHCSGGWYVQEWEIVFGEKPQVELVETMLEGADSCLFAVRIPLGWL